MKDEEERILYVGKSINIKNRVRSYFSSSADLSPRIKLMTMQVADIEFIVTDNESEALVLESNLIKNNQPYFNILLKDDKKYPYLCITWSEEYPRLFITRRRRFRNKLDKFYGPYVDVTNLRRTLFLVKRLFPLRQRPRPLHKDRTCLNYEIGRCPGVCQEKITTEEYKMTLRKVEMIFQGRSNELTLLLERQMHKYSENMNYEKAGFIRDQIKQISVLTEDQKMSIPDSTLSRDVLAIAHDNRAAVIQLFKIRAGKLVGRLGFSDDSKNQEPGIILQRVIEEHYSSVDYYEIPEELVIQFELPQNKLIADWLSKLKGTKVNLVYPKRGKKAEIINLVHKNANYELSIKNNDLQKNNLSLEDIAQLLELTSLPKRIECYDISHISGSDAVGSQVVFIDGFPAKQHYRRYKIKNKDVKIGHSDDFLSLAEVIKRRFRRWAIAKSEGLDIEKLSNQKTSILDNNGLNDWPDLVVIDGGKGQLSSVINVLSELKLNADLNVCSLAKRNEEIYLPGMNQPLSTEVDQLGLILLRRIRDEAHRFAIQYHRAKRSSRMTRSRLSDINGLGPKRIKDLLSYFNSIEAIQLASVDELSKVPGLGIAMAKKIWIYFHSD